MRRTTALLCLGGLLLLLACEQTPDDRTINSSQETKSSSPETATKNAGPTSSVVTDQQPTAAIARRKRIVRIWRDNSTSMSERAYSAALDKVLEDVLVNINFIDGVEVVVFGNGKEPLWSEQPVEFFWGPPPAIEKFEEPDSKEATLDQKLYNDSWNEHVADVRREFDAKQERKTELRRQLIASKFNELRAFLSVKPTEPARCTRFDSLATRVSREDLPINVVLTDGWNDCGNQVLPKEGYGMDGKLLIILIPRHADTEEDENAFGQREAEMRRFFPNSKVLPSYLAKGALSQFLANH
jgi:hypothetical protein